MLNGCYDVFHCFCQMLHRRNGVLYGRDDMLHSGDNLLDRRDVLQ